MLQCIVPLQIIIIIVVYLAQYYSILLEVRLCVGSVMKLSRPGLHWRASARLKSVCANSKPRKSKSVFG